MVEEVARRAVVLLEGTTRHYGFIEALRTASARPEADRGTAPARAKVARGLPPTGPGLLAVRRRTALPQDSVRG